MSHRMDYRWVTYDDHMGRRIDYRWFTGLVTDGLNIVIYGFQMNHWMGYRWIVDGSQMNHKWVTY